MLTLKIKLIEAQILHLWQKFIELGLNLQYIQVSGHFFSFSSILKGVLAAKSCLKARGTYRKNITNIIIIFWSKKQTRVTEMLTFQKERHGTGCFARSTNLILHGSRDVLEQSRQTQLEKDKNFCPTQYFSFPILYKILQIKSHLPASIFIKPRSGVHVIQFLAS